MALKIIKKLTKQKYHLFLKRGSILFFFIIYFSSCNGFPTQIENVCRTLECNKTALRVLKYMDATENPCDNFYKFACGNFLNYTSILDDQEKVDTFSVITGKVLEQLEIIVREKISPNTPKRLKLVKTFYDICMNETAMKQYGTNPLKDKFNKLGGWPVLEGTKWNEDAFNWTNTLYTLREMGYSFNYLFNLEVATDLKNNTRRVINLKMPELGLGFLFTSKGLEDKTVKNYRKYMVDVAVLLGADREYAEKELINSFLLEVVLDNSSLQNIIKIGDTYNEMTVTELEVKYPSIPWLEYFNKIFQPHFNVDKNQKIFVYIPYYLSEFEKTMNTTSKRTLANYMLWRVFIDSVAYLNDEIREPQIEFTNSLTGQSKETPKSKQCFDNILLYLSHSIGALYVKNYFNDAIKNNTRELVNHIESQLKVTLEKLDWMDEETKKNALDKVNAITNRIAYDDGILDDDKMNEAYKNFDLSENSSYLDMILSIRLFKYNITFKLLKSSFDKNNSSFYMNPTIVNAFYLANYNEMILPAAVLQGNFFNVDRPR
ncbi:Similar to Nep2: Neprilysin-2 (Drosophila melanogaster) [Cotesia congregata]|uniref:Similar to Nep2: Neprilysin-2 (Drosophila melanogaster) n=1 Tax=Cotesia congregata TaxID=51543 RepID=A0A8J2ED84_COTCN|nr:Similar to Nep2: Neprilysin-2 (Drosophila melanogaster) [Cotesia congregata]